MRLSETYQPQLKLSDRDELFKSIWLHYTFFVPLAEIQQLRKGLRETLQVELLTALYPDEMHSFLVGSSMFDVTPTFLCDSFVIRYSETGSNKRAPEEAVILNWTDYIMECSGETMKTVITYCLHFHMYLLRFFYISCLIMCKQDGFRENFN